MASGPTAASNTATNTGCASLRQESVCFAVPAKKAITFQTAKERTYPIEYVNDTGAGRPIYSNRAFIDQGVPSALVKKESGPASVRMSFETGGGIIESRTSLPLSSELLGSIEAFHMHDSPFAVSCGQTVERRKHPFIWIPGILPYHVTDLTKLKIICPEQYKKYAARVDDFVPIFREEMTIGGRKKTKTPPKLTLLPATASSSSSSSTGGSGSEGPPPEDGDGRSSSSTTTTTTTAATGDGVDEVIEVPEVPSETGMFARKRSMSKRSLILEANSPLHLCGHYPHNPLCDVCRVAHLQHKSYHRTTPADRSDLPQPTGPGQLLSADTLIISRAAAETSNQKPAGPQRTSMEGHSCGFTVRDTYSGVGLVFPQRRRNQDANYRAFKHFQGPSWQESPHIIVKSDAAKDIVNAVSQMGWHPEPSLENAWPHNAVHERWQRTLKSVQRAVILQSGFNTEAWNWSMPYAAVVLAISQLAPLLPHEKDDDDKPKPEFVEKSNWTCWRAHHRGATFKGPLEPFGRLCHYYDASKHTLEPQSSPGLFVGWRIESGCRYKGVILVADYERLRQGDFSSLHSLRALPEKEVFFPTDLCFPFAEARQAALRTITSQKGLPPCGGSGTQGPPPSLPFDEEAGENEEENIDHELSVQLPPMTKSFRISKKRIHDFGETPGCLACESGDSSFGHTDYCKARIMKLVDETKAKQVIGFFPEEPVSFTSAPAAADEHDSSSTGSSSREGQGVVSQGPLDPQQEDDVLSLFFPGFPPGGAPGGATTEEDKESFAVTSKASARRGSGSEGPPPADSSTTTNTTNTTTSGSSSSSRKPPPKKTVAFDMTDYCRDVVRHYCQIIGKGVKLKKAATPFPPEGSLKPEDDEEKGELGPSAVSPLMKGLWLCRLARPDSQKAIQFMATRVQNWSVNDDKRLLRAVSYLWTTRDYRLVGQVCDHSEDLYLTLYVDADFCGDFDDTKSTTGAVLVLTGPNDTFMPLAWICKKQTATSRSTTEAEIVALAFALFSEALPTIGLWELILGRPVKLVIMEDNEATIKIAKAGYSLKLRHLTRHQKVNIGTIAEVLDNELVEIPHCPSAKQAADILTKALPPAKWPAALDLLHIEQREPANPSESPFGQNAETSPAVVASGPTAASYSTSTATSNKAVVASGSTASTTITTVRGRDAAVRVIRGLVGVAQELKTQPQMKILARSLVKSFNNLEHYESVPTRLHRRSQKLPGYGLLIECCCEENSALGRAAGEYEGVRVLRVTKDIDFENKDTIEQLHSLADSKPGISLHGSLPCTTVSSWQQVCIKRYGISYEEDLERRRKCLRKMLQSFLTLAEKILKNGGAVSFEWPRHCLGWMFKELLQFILRWRLCIVDVDGCACGLVDKRGRPFLKQWRFLTSEPAVAKSLSQLRCQHPHNFKHATIQGDETKRTGSYPLPLCRTLLSALFGEYRITPAMTVHAVSDYGHRHKEPNDTIFGFTVNFKGDQDDIETSSAVVASGPTASNANVGNNQVSRQKRFKGPLPTFHVPKAFGLVTRLLDRKEVRADPLAQQAIWTEAQALLKEGTWLEDTMMDKDDLIRLSRSNGKKIHMGNLLTICSIKFAERASEHWRYKGRICFRGDDVKDEYGAPAIFQQLSASPTTVHAANSTVAYGTLPDNETEVSDAIRAYIQSVLGSKYETWVLIPPELRPKHWRAKRPMCKLVKALYGHPESGAHWERHLEKAVRAIGGEPVPDHPSSFFFSATKMLLTVYVDDLMLAGPKGGHAEIWKGLSDQKIALEEPESLSRFLGRGHEVVVSGPTSNK